MDTSDTFQKACRDCGKHPDLTGARTKSSRSQVAQDQADRARFWLHVNKTSDSDCWLWTGSRQSGYGRCNFGGRADQLAHRISWQLATGPIEAGMHVLHRCDVPLCVNPAHLFLGTHRDNMRDMRAKGRGRSGVLPGLCIRGHSLTGANIQTNGANKRTCRTCLRERRRVRLLSQRQVSQGANAS